MLCYSSITVDDHEVMREDIGAGGFWERGDFDGDNLWASGTKAAPFDQPVSMTAYSRYYYLNGD